MPPVFSDGCKRKVFFFVLLFFFFVGKKFQPDENGVFSACFISVFFLFLAQVEAIGVSICGELFSVWL